ncbi:MAG: DNRLRE domain-containing protein [Planctomycetota bacterium]|jgi:type II secretory pathway pseudopilin PulG
MRTRATTSLRRLERGFTILELLVVIFIMLAMTGIAVAAFRQFMDTERIKLAGGQVVSAIRMGRQYAMSKRTRVMIEFVDPVNPANSFNHPDTPKLDQCRVRGGTYKDTVYTNTPCMRYRSTDDTYAYKGVLKFDISSLPPEADLVEALLVMDINVNNRTQVIEIRQLTDDAWTSADTTWNTVALITGSKVGDFTIPADADGEYVVNLTEHAVDVHAGDKTMSLLLNPLSGDNYSYVNGATLKMVYELPTGETEETVSHMSREVRIIPYIRERNKVTGGFAWLLDQDASSLRVMKLPRNVLYELTPARTSVDQYEPTDLDDSKKPVRKVFFDMLPDGTCVARAPDIAGWTNRVNTLIMRDAVTGDVALLFVPPSSAFTRQRYLFGDEVDAFVAAYSLYSLW